MKPNLNGHCKMVNLQLLRIIGFLNSILLLNIWSVISGLVTAVHVQPRSTESMLSKADRSHFVASRPLSSINALPLGCPSLGACWGIQIQHREIIARPLILCWSAAEWHELLTFYFNLLAWVFLSKGVTEKHKWFCSLLCSTWIIQPFLCSCLFKREVELSFHCSQWRPISHIE